MTTTHPRQQSIDNRHANMITGSSRPTQNRRIADCISAVDLFC